MLLQGSAALVIRTGLRAAYGYLVVYAGLLVFGLMCLIWSGAAGVPGHLLPRARGGGVGRGGPGYRFLFYVLLPALSGAVRFYLRALDAFCVARTLMHAAEHLRL